MIVSKEGQLPAASDWQLEFARLIAFPDVPALFADRHWWHDLAKEEPADYVLTRTKHTREERGNFQGANLSLFVDLDRVEWVVKTPDECDDAEGGKLPTLGPLRQKVDWFVELLTPWLEKSCPPLARMAFAGKLLQPADTVSRAYEILAKLLPGVKLDPNPNDFLYQVNRRTTSTVVPGLSLNRVSVWSKLTVPVMVETPGSFQQRPSWPDNCYCAVELDINTAPERTGVLPRESLPGLFRELADLGIKIAEHGDIPE